MIGKQGKQRRWRKEKKRFVPSPSAAFRYLSNFHPSGFKVLMNQDTSIKKGEAV